MLPPTMGMSAPIFVAAIAKRSVVGFEAWFLLVALPALILLVTIVAVAMRDTRKPKPTNPATAIGSAAAAAMNAGKAAAAAPNSGRVPKAKK